MYSQFAEESHIAQHTPEMGRFLDIGAFHPTCMSNTRALYERGWSGVMIEPSPIPFDSLLREYGKDERITLICAAVARFGAELIQIHATADAVSTTVDAEAELWKDAGGYYGKFFIPTIALEGISLQFGHVDFINFDAEGISVDLFRRAMEIGWRPKCVCVEIDKRMEELAGVATGHGYKIVYANTTNIVAAL